MPPIPEARDRSPTRPLLMLPRGGAKVSMIAEMPTITGAPTQPARPTNRTALHQEAFASVLILVPAFLGHAREIRQMKWRLLLPGASEPRLAELNPLGL